MVYPSLSIPIHFMGHDVIEIVLSHESIIIKVSFHEYFFDFFISQVFSKILCDFLQLKNCEFSLNIISILQHC